MAFWKKDKKKKAGKTEVKVPKVEEVEVCESKPVLWREFENNGEWTQNYVKKLLQDIQDSKPMDDSRQRVRILFLGPIKAGKSSFLNTVASIDKGRIARVAPSGGTQGRSLTKTIFRPQGKLKNFRLLDTMGVEEADLCGLNEEDVLSLVNGHIKPNYEFNPVNPIKAANPLFSRTPQEKDKVQCVVFVMDANVVGQNNISDSARKKVSSLQAKLESQRIPRMVILTKIDVLCDMVEADITKSYESAKVKKAVYMAAELFHTEVNNIFPLKNYTDEMDLKPMQDILLLLALRQMVRFGSDYLKELSVKTSDDEDSATEN